MAWYRCDMLQRSGMLYTNSSESSAAALPVLVFLHVLKGTSMFPSLSKAM